MNLLKCFYRLLVLLVVCTFGLPGTLRLTAQQNARNLTGTVTDGHHEPLSGAVVQVHGDVTETVVSFITDRSGQYSFKRLQGDLDYGVSATWRGHRSEVKKLSQFDTNRNKVIDFTITQ